MVQKSLSVIVAILCISLFASCLTYYSGHREHNLLLDPWEDEGRPLPKMITITMDRGSVQISGTRASIYWEGIYKKSGVSSNVQSAICTDLIPAIYELEADQSLTLTIIPLTDTATITVTSAFPDDKTGTVQHYKISKKKNPFGKTLYFEYLEKEETGLYPAQPAQGAR